MVATTTAVPATAMPAIAPLLIAFDASAIKRTQIVNLHHASEFASYMLSESSKTTEVE